MKVESYSSLWSHCCLFCSYSFLQLLSHLSEITVSLAALIPWYLLCSLLLEPGTSTLLSAQIILITTQADLSPSQQLSCGLRVKGTPQAADSHKLLPTAVGRGDELLSSVIFYQSLWSLVWSLPRSVTQTGLYSHGNWRLLTQFCLFTLSTIPPIY